MPLHLASLAAGSALLAFRSPPDIFSAGGKKAARRKRDQAIPDTSAFDGSPHLCVELRWGNEAVRQVRSGGAWIDLCLLPDRDN